MIRTFCAVTAIASVLPAVATACILEAADPLDGFTPLDPAIYLDLPDPEMVRATAAIENSILTRMISDGRAGLTKTFCDIGIQDMVIDFSEPVEDDAILAVLTRAVFIWDSSDEPVGWRLDRLGERPLCARGDDPFAAICP